MKRAGAKSPAAPYASLYSETKIRKVFFANKIVLALIGRHPATQRTESIITQKTDPERARTWQTAHPSRQKIEIVGGADRFGFNNIRDRRHGGANGRCGNSPSARVSRQNGGAAGEQLKVSSFVRAYERKRGVGVGRTSCARSVGSCSPVAERSTSTRSIQQVTEEELNLRCSIINLEAASEFTETIDNGSR